MKGALMIGLAEPKSSGSSEDAYIDEAFSAVKDDDKEGFRTAFKAAVKACAKSYGHKAESDDDDEE
jgi:hypothetical protein